MLAFLSVVLITVVGILSVCPLLRNYQLFGWEDNTYHNKYLNILTLLVVFNKMQVR